MTIAAEQHLVATGKAVPPPVVGAVLVDTGATRTCISVAAASALGLRPTRVGTTHGAGGEHKNPVYPAMLRLLIAGRKQQTTSINHQGEFIGIPDLEQSAKAFGMKTDDGVQLDLVGLIGRDLLRYAKLSYDGLLGKLEIQFNLKAINR